MDDEPGAEVPWPSLVGDGGSHGRLGGGNPRGLAVEQVLGGIAAVTSTDGLSRILGPIIILYGLFAGALAVAGLVGSWRTARSRGRRQIAAPIGGLLTAIGAWFLHMDGPPTDQMLPAFAFAMAAIGTGVATSGWIPRGVARLARLSSRANGRSAGSAVEFAWAPMVASPASKPAQASVGRDPSMPTLPMQAARPPEAGRSS
jgi:hypothetical protein